MGWERNAARALFRQLELTYADITLDALKMLWVKTDKKLIEHLATGGEHAYQMNMRMAPMRKKDVSFSRSGLLRYACLEVNGSYFRRREAITFSITGSIGFCYELSDDNARPVLLGFREWATEMCIKKNT